MMRPRISQQEWVRRKVDVLPDYIARGVLEKHSELIGTIGPHSTSPFFVANQWLVGQRNELLDANIWEAYDEGLIRDVAVSYARACEAMPQLARREQFAIDHGIEPPVGKFLGDRYEARAARLADHLWWRRRLRALWLRRAEESLRRAGVVRKGKCAYASDSAIDQRRGQKRRMREYCEAHVASNELGEQLGLFELQQHSVANPTLRRGEFMTRVRGFEEVALAVKHEALFFTLTTPSHFHPQLAAGGANPTYDRSQTVRTAQAWLCKYWSHFRSAISRRKVLLYGFRIAEPHHDGTPHWHGLMFCRAVDVAFVESELRKHFLKDHGDDRGAREHRVSVEHIDASKGSAAGYIAKYVSKNIDGAGSIGAASSDETGAAVVDGVQRVDAWAALHGIRQFQQLGGPAIGLWRECRRLRDPVDDIDIERARLAADRGNFARFTACVGGVVVGRRTALKYLKEETGELTRYGECRGARILGLRYASAQVITRPHRWKIERKGRGCKHLSTDAVVTSGATVDLGSDSSAESSLHLGPVAITVRVIPGTRTCIGGRWWEMTFPGQPGVPTFISARDIDT
jgi:hypothetical protein